MSDKVSETKLNFDRKLIVVIKSKVMPRLQKAILGLAAFVLLLVSTIPVPAFSQITTCSGSVSPNSLRPGVTYTLTFTVGGADGDVVWIKISRPSENFILKGASADDWEISTTDNYALFQGITLSATNFHQLRLVVQAGATEVPSQDWLVEMSGYEVGSDPLTCSGDLGVSVSSSAGESDLDYPLISGITVAEITALSVKVNWTTNKPADSFVEYGLTTNYGLSLSNATLVTNHTLTLTGLQASSTYHYRIKTKDTQNQTTISGDNTFTTAKQVSAAAAPTTPSTGSDGATPSAVITTDLSKPFKLAPTLVGIARDNTAVRAVEYSLDDGRNWSPVDSLQKTTAKEVSFSFTPTVVEDGNYLIRVRATDQSGLVGISDLYTLVVDQLPPRVGATLMTLGPYLLNPSFQGLVTALAGVDLKIALSAVGGPTTIDLLVGGKVFSLVKNPDSGLWFGALSFDEQGVYQIDVRALDGAGNLTDRELNKVVVLGGGLVKSGREAVTSAQVEVYVFDALTQDFNLWDGAPFGQANPQKTKEDGRYSFFLPEGKYYLQVKKDGFRLLKTKIFAVSQPQPVNTEFSLTKAFGIKIGSLKISLPFQTQEEEMIIKLPTLPSVEDPYGELLDKPLPTLKLTDENGQFLSTSLLGKPTIVTLVNSWSPSAAEQLAALSEIESGEINQIVVVSQESTTRAQIFKKRGRYELKIVADPDGELADTIGLVSVPTHLFIDRKGVVQSVVVGSLSADELLKNLKN